MATNPTKAELQRQLDEAQARLEALEKQAAAKPVVVTARVPLELREQMKATATRNGQNLQTFMLNAFTEHVQRLSPPDQDN